MNDIITRQMIVNNKRFIEAFDEKQIEKRAKEMEEINKKVIKNPLKTKSK